MRVVDLAQLSTRMFKTNPMRTWLTILGMGVGTGAVVMLVGLGFGLQQIILEQIVFGETLLSLGVSSTGSHSIVVNDQAVTEMKKIPHVQDVSPLARFPALIKYKGLTGNLFLQGAEPAYIRYSGLSASAGTVFTDADAGNDTEVMISPAVIKLFGIDKPDQIIGQQVSFKLLIPAPGKPDQVDEVPIDKTFRVKGVTKEDSVLNALIMLPELRKYVGINEYDRAQVRVESSDFLAVTEKALIDKGFRVTALSKTVEQASKIFQGIQAVLAAVGSIALTVSAIGMFNTMTVTLLERTKEIGIMRTIGASPTDIKLLFVSESVLVGFLGGVSGIVMGVGFGLIMNLALNILATNFGGKAVALFAFPAWFLIFIAVFSALVGYLTGIFPARRASLLNPLDAMRYE